MNLNVYGADQQKQHKRPLRLLCATTLCIAAVEAQAANIEGLEVEYRDRPIGIDVTEPRFSWRMQSEPGAYGQLQTAYRIRVTDPGGDAVWDSGRVEDTVSLGVTYEGEAVQPATRYDWTVTVWDEDGEASEATSWFETGLLDTTLEAWEGAEWIGGGDDDLVLYSDYLPLFDLRYTLQISESSTRASVVLAANDPRLMDTDKNIFQTEAGLNESYFKIELDVSAVDGTDGGHALLNVYRAGYTPEDDAGTPVARFEVSPDAIDASNSHAPHDFLIHATFGELTIQMDGRDDFFVNAEGDAQEAGFYGDVLGATVNLNPAGRGHDYLTYGMLSDIGFAVEPGQEARVSNLSISNTMKPHAELFREDLSAPDYGGVFAAQIADAPSSLTVANGGYHISGGAEGAMIIADPSREGSPLLRTEFATGAEEIIDARLYVTARGVYEMYLNGERIGDDHYNPGLTQYNVTHLYQTYDVTPLIEPGDNALGAMLGEGWWSGQLSFGAHWNYFGDRQSLLAKLVITYAGGKRQVITTNEDDWRFSTDGPIRYSSFTQGEVYDAQRETVIDGWSEAGFDDADWGPAGIVPLEGTTNDVGMGRNADPITYDNIQLVGQIGASAGVYDTLTAQDVTEVREGVYVYDLGQNVFGVPRITFPDGEAGRTVTVRYSELLYPDLEASGDNVGMIMTENLRAALSQDIYVMKDGPQVFQPRFTAHGFQYIEISGLDEPLPPDAVQGVAISSIEEITAGYDSCNALVNQLWSNLIWSNIDNFMSVPTDCPQRNERMGWSGDINVFARTATYASDAAPFLQRHMRAMRDTQRADGRFTDIAPVGGGFGGILWGSAGVTIPWETYQQYGDVATLREHYDAMVAYVDYIDTTLDPETGLSSDAVLGDWLGPQNNQLGQQFLAAAYHIYNLEVVARTAEVLDKPEDAERFWERRAERQAYFNETFVNEAKKTMGYVGDGFWFGDNQPAEPEWRVADTQSSYAVGLALGAFSDDNIPHMVENLIASVERGGVDDFGAEHGPYSLMTGFIGTAWISKALSDHGASDLAYRLIQNSDYPSWLYPVEQGATTIWERLNGYTVEDGFGGNNSMNSFNHYSFGAVGQWLISHSLGIARGEPGFQSFVLQPEPDPTDQMSCARGFYDSPYGRIESGWELDGERLLYRAHVPANTSATLRLPTSTPDSLGEDHGAPAGSARFIAYEDGHAVFELASGSYAFAADR